MAKDGGIPGILIAIGLVIYLVAKYWWILLIIAAIGLLIWIISNTKKSDATTKQSASSGNSSKSQNQVLENKASRIEQHVQSSVQTAVEKVSESVANDQINAADTKMPTDESFEKWLKFHNDLVLKANEQRHWGNAEKEKSICESALTSQELADLEEYFRNTYESYWKNRLSMLEEGRSQIKTESPSENITPVVSVSREELPPLYSRTDKQYLLHQRDIDFIDRFIFQAKIALSGSPEFAPIKLIQTLCGSYQKSGNEQNIFEYLKENLAGSSGLSKPTTTEREIALEVVDSLQRGDEDKEIIKRITANRHIDKVATQDPIYSLAMDVLLRQRADSAKFDKRLELEKTVCQEALDAIDGSGGSAYRNFWEERMKTVMKPNRIAMARIDSFPLKAFKKIQDPYAQKVISYLGSYKGAFQSSGNADEDIYEYFLEKAEKRIKQSSSNDIATTFTDFKNLVLKLQETDDDEVVIAWIKENVAKTSINFSESERKVVPWAHVYVYGTGELDEASPSQKSYYKYFKEQFLAGKCLDLEGYSNYAFVLMFDLADSCTSKDKLDELERNLSVLGEHYPKTKHYIDATLEKVQDRFLAQQSKELLNAFDNVKPTKTRWIKVGETVTVAGMKLTRGGFYLGNYLEVPEKNVSYFSYGGRKGFKFLGPVVNPVLEAKYVANAEWSSFSSYSTLTKGIRYRYLSFLSGDIPIDQIESALLCLYIMGIEYRLFVDEETTKEEKESLVRLLVDIYFNHKSVPVNVENITDNAASDDVYDEEDEDDDDEDIIFDDEEENDDWDYNFGTRDMVSDLVDRALCTLMPDNFRELVGNFPVRQLKYYSRFLLNAYVDKGKKISHAKAFDFSVDYLDLLSGIPDNEANREALKNRFIEHMKSWEQYYPSSSSSYRSGNTTVNERLGDSYTYNFPLFRQESHEVTYGVTYPKSLASDNVIYAVTNTANRVRSDSWKHWELLRDNGGIPTAYADMNFASYINPSSLPTLVELASDIEGAMDGDGYAMIEVNEFVKRLKYPPRKENGIYKPYAQVIVEALRKMGFGIAPNPNVAGDRLMYGAYCCLYKLSGGNKLSDDVLKGQAVVKMAAQIAMSDKITMNDIHLIESGLFSLGFEGDTLKYEVAYARSYSSLKQNFYTSKIIQELSASKVPAIYKLLLRMTFNGGDVSTARVKTLKRYCKYLGQDPEKIHSGIHEAMTTDEFATVEKTTGAVRYSIPKPEEVTRKFSIDTGKLERMEKQTKEAQELLSDIFVEEQPAEAKKPSGEVEAVRDILSQLLEKEVWEFAEVDEICKSKGLMTGYVLEKINDLSYEKVDDAVVDQDGDQVFVTTDYKEQLI